MSHMMPCPICGQPVTTYTPGQEATTERYACGYTITDIREGHHPTVLKQPGMPAWGVVLIAIIVAAVIAFGNGYYGTVEDAIASTVAELRALRATIFVFASFILYAQWRTIRLLETQR